MLQTNVSVLQHKRFQVTTGTCAAMPEVRCPAVLSSSFQLYFFSLFFQSAFCCSVSAALWAHLSYLASPPFPSGFLMPIQLTVSLLASVKTHTTWLRMHVGENSYAILGTVKQCNSTDATQIDLWTYQLAYSHVLPPGESSPQLHFMY